MESIGNDGGDALAALVAGRDVLSFLSDDQAPVHAALVRMGARAVWSVDPRPRDDLSGHILQQWERDLQSQSLTLHPCIYERRGQPAVILPVERLESGRARLAAWTGNERCVVIHPGSGGREKCWPLANFLAVAALLKKSAVGVLWLLGPAELERWEASAVLSMGDIAPVVSGAGADDLLGMLAGAAALLGNDAGPSHLAATIGTPVTALFGPTSARCWRPLGPGVRVIQGDPGASDGRWGIQPERVASQVIESIRETA